MYPFHEKMLKQTQDFAVASLLVLTNKTSRPTWNSIAESLKLSRLEVFNLFIDRY